MPCSNATSASTTPGRRRHTPVAKAFACSWSGAPANQYRFSRHPVHGGTGLGVVSPNGSGTNAERDRSSGNWRYTVVAGKAKWKFRLR
jgi:hypothetical protein